MALNWYWAVIEKTDEGYFAHLPDLPGPTARGDTDKEALMLLAEFADDHIGDLVADRQSVPGASDEPERDPDIEEWGRALVPVEVPGTTIKVSISIDQALLKRIDQVAERVGESRSGFIAGAALQRIRAEKKSALTVSDVRALQNVSLADIVKQALETPKA